MDESKIKIINDTDKQKSYISNDQNIKIRDNGFQQRQEIFFL